jgi:DNA-binding transcriptional MerR regulator
MKANEQLAEALRLAVDPPGGVSVEALQYLVLDDLSRQWDIATAAQHVGVSPHTLRYYERIGLITVSRNAAGHRVYDAASIRRLVFLTRMRTSGMPISDLRHYVALVDRGDATIPDRLDLLLEHRDTLRAQLRQIQLALAATEYKIATYGGSAQP